MTAELQGQQFSPQDLCKYDGSNPDVPVYVAVKGTVFDVSQNRDMYTPGKGNSCFWQGYSVFAGKDASKALGMSSLDIANCISDYSGLSPEEVLHVTK